MEQVESYRPDVFFCDGPAFAELARLAIQLAESHELGLTSSQMRGGTPLVIAETIAAIENVRNPHRHSFDDERRQLFGNSGSWRALDAIESLWSIHDRLLVRYEWQSICEAPPNERSDDVAIWTLWKHFDENFTADRTGIEKDIIDLRRTAGVLDSIANDLRNGDGGKQAGRTPPHPPASIEVDLAANKVTIEGKRFTIEPHHARFVAKLIKERASGEWYVTGKTATMTLPGWRGKNVTREVRSLKAAVPPLDALITSNQKGYRLTQ